MESTQKKSEPVHGEVALNGQNRIRSLSQDLHPDFLTLAITEIKDLTPTSKSFFFESVDGRPLPLFRAGQYLSFREKIEGAPISRPYSLANSPTADGKRFPRFEIAIRRKPGGFFSQHVWNVWKVGTRVQATGPHGNFYFEPLRDSSNLIALAGGSGIVPFLSMAREIVDSKEKRNLTILYGNQKVDDIMFRHELQALADQGRGRINFEIVCAESSPDWKGRVGYLDRKLIVDRVEMAQDPTFFVCGPSGFYDFLDEELERLDLAPRRYRREVYGEIPRIHDQPDFPDSARGKTFSVGVTSPVVSCRIESRPNDSILNSLERAGINIDSQCRSGECGMCRCELVSGEVHMNLKSDGRRAYEKANGILHTCCSYPVTDIEIRIQPAKSFRRAGVGKSTQF